MSLERIDKILAHEGFGTRKGIRKLLRECDVTVNGQKVSDPGMQVNPDKDVIFVDDEEIILRKNVYIMMNKMQGVVSANKDGLHQTAFDYLSDEYKTPYLQEHLHIVGRLDIDTEGLLFFTTDGALTHKIISPKTHFPKEYFVRLKKSESKTRQEEIKELFFQGIHIPAEGNESEADCKSATLVWKSNNEALLTITEGKFHQVKRMFAAVENEVVYLKRLSIGPLKLDESLALGEYRELTDDEVSSLVI